jgi:heme O synthase-like polyprenyltransferase
MSSINNYNRPTVRIFRNHIMYPIILTAIFFVNAFTPVYVLGCLARGYVALSIALISGIGSLYAAIMGLKGRVHREANAGWWMVSSLILLIPVVALIILA